MDIQIHAHILYAYFFSFLIIHRHRAVLGTEIATIKLKEDCFQLLLFIVSAALTSMEELHKGSNWGGEEVVGRPACNLLFSFGIFFSTALSSSMEQQ